MGAGTGSTILVTGGSGFTGGQLARSLAARRYDVRVLARTPERARDLRTAGIEICQGDLKDRASLARACRGVRLVFNVAAIYRQAGVPASEYRAVNAEAVGALIEAAAGAGVRRVVHCSTVGVHGDVEHPPAAEDAPLRPGDIYQQTKLEGERIAREAADRTGVELVIVRPSGIYGPGDRRLLKLFRGIARKRFVVLGSGQIYYHLTYVDDLTEGFRLCGETGSAAGRTYILAGGEVTRLNELVRLIAREAGVKPLPVRLPVWPFCVAGAICEGICVPLGIEPP
ncbi:MAG: NAD-dependent epimerase/dehydratase family protein, partial [Acidobacteria bacterium]|nr:NAD-dependent epimerase/dehydratase family protein [Acidobacteriota bacterium]